VVNSYYKPSLGKLKPRRRSHEERLIEQEQERLAKEEKRKERIRLDREERRRKAFNEVVELYIDIASTLIRMIRILRSSVNYHVHFYVVVLVVV
jgi:hypothetical protein